MRTKGLLSLLWKLHWMVWKDLLKVKLLKISCETEFSEDSYKLKKKNHITSEGICI